GAGFCAATVSWQEDNGKKGKLREVYKEEWDMCWVTSSKAGINALANYCAVLVQLEIDVWKDFLATFVTDMFGIGKDKVRSALDKA
ncbi:MAG: hypothetical protein IJ587_01420, partial [Synergistaceae bacterium]|nr:hypothetical protein [Synergistaceae bacterium]